MEPARLQFAGQPDILRAAERDNNFKQLINFKVLEVLEILLKYNVITKYEKEIKLLTDTIYYMLTTGKNWMTLGEEYCQIAPHGGTGNTIVKKDANGSNYETFLTVRQRVLFY